MKRVQRVRDNALNQAVETKAKLILKEKKEAKNEKRYKQLVKDEMAYMKEKFDEIHEKRA